MTTASPVPSRRASVAVSAHIASATRRAASASSSSGTFGRTSSQSGSIIPDASTIPSGRGRNQTWKCAPPSPQRYRWTRATSPSERIARSTRAATCPKSAASSSGRSANESTWTRLASQTAPGRLPPTGGWSVQFSSDQTALVVAPLQIAARRAARLAAPRRLGDLPFGGLAWDERLLIRQRHRHRRGSFRRGRGAVGRAPAMPFSTRPTIRVRARSAAQAWRPRRWTYGQATPLNARSAASTTSSKAGNDPSSAPSRKNRMNGCR